MCLCIYVQHIHVGAHWGQKRALDSLELELQFQWVLELELGFSAGALSTCALIAGPHILRRIFPCNSEFDPNMFLECYFYIYGWNFSLST